MKKSMFKKFIASPKSKNSHAKTQRRKEYAKPFRCDTFAALLLCVMLCLLAQPLFAQGYGGALTFQGVDHYALHSAAGRAMGGVTISLKQDIGMMFQNPAALQSLQGIQVSLGGLQLWQDAKQEQNYAPVRYYSNLSLLLEGLTARIPNPDTLFFGFTAQDTVQRPYDNITPNWSRSKNDKTPLQGLLAVPLSFGDFKAVAGLGAVQYADLDYFYQNNNVLSPAILSQRPLPTFRPTDDNPLEVKWSQALYSRVGSMQGYGIALAGGVGGFSIGLSGLILDGSSDDFEQEVGRATLTFFSNAFRADSVFREMTTRCASDYSGQEFTLSSLLSGRYVSAGFSLKPPTTITRTFKRLVETKTTHSSLSTIQGEDKLKLPWRGTVGLALAPRENLTVGLEYELRPYESVRYVDSDGTETSPWLSAALFRIGTEYRIASWLALRGGMRGDAEVFQPEGNYIDGEPVTYTVYSAGLGVFFSGLNLNMAYENSLMKYQDIWSSAISKNSERRHAVVAQVTYEIPWTR